MTNDERQSVRLNRVKASTRRADSDTVGGGKSQVYMSKLRIDGIDDDVAPEHIRGLLEKFGKAGEVSIHSGQDCTYVLADLPYEEAEDAVQFLHNTRWREGRIRVQFANCASWKTWLSGHDWKPPKA